MLISDLDIHFIKPLKKSNLTLSIEQPNASANLRDCCAHSGPLPDTKAGGKPENITFYRTHAFYVFLNLYSQLFILG